MSHPLVTCISEIEDRVKELEAALRAIDKHLDEFGYGRSMKARKMIAAALNVGNQTVKNSEKKIF